MLVVTCFCREFLVTVRPTFPLKLEKTYYAQGFFNVKVDYDRYVGREGDVELVLGASTITARIDRTANQNGTARVMGGGGTPQLVPAALPGRRGRARALRVAYPARTRLAPLPHRAASVQVSSERRSTNKEICESECPSGRQNSRSSSRGGRQISAADLFPLRRFA